MSITAWQASSWSLVTMTPFPAASPLGSRPWRPQNNEINSVICSKNQHLCTDNTSGTDAAWLIWSFFFYYYFCGPFNICRAQYCLRMCLGSIRYFILPKHYKAFFSPFVRNYNSTKLQWRLHFLLQSEFCVFNVSGKQNFSAGNPNWPCLTINSENYLLIGQCRSRRIYLFTSYVPVCLCLSHIHSSNDTSFVSICCTDLRM